MREFKYRAWDKENKVMCDVEMLGEVILKIKGSEWENREDFVVMQFTGLCDKNGREIYEGDIVRFSPYWVEHPWTSRVVWGKEFAGHVVKGKADDSEEDVLDDEMIEDAEVIGNIFEHPELLK